MLKSMNEIRHLWEADNITDAISRAMYLTTYVEVEIMTLCSENVSTKGAINNIACQRQMILNLLSPYGDENGVSDEFRNEVKAMFTKENPKGWECVIGTKWNE